MKFQLSDIFGNVQNELHNLTNEITQLKGMMEKLCYVVTTQQKEISDLNHQLKTFNKIIKGSPKGVEKEDLVTFYTQKNRAKMILKGKGIK